MRQGKYPNVITRAKNSWMIKYAVKTMHEKLKETWEIADSNFEILKYDSIYSIPRLQIQLWKKLSQFSTCLLALYSIV